MKQLITKEDFDSLPLTNQLFLALWKETKGYSENKEYSFGELVELALALTNDLHFEVPAEKSTFNNALHYNEVHIAWDGQEPIDILWYELNQKLRQRIQGYLTVNSVEKS